MGERGGSMPGFFPSSQHQSSPQHQSSHPNKDKHRAPEIAAHSAGNITSFHVSSEPDKWIVDTGATNHMTPNLGMLHGAYEQQRQNVHLPNGSKATISHIGQCRLPQGVI